MISLKKVTAGSGYDYLIRQVAAQDVTIGTGLAAYYEQKGETPGVWMGSGLTGLEGITAGDPVTEAQMKALFGNGLHPLTDEIRTAALQAGLSERDAEKACRLGRPFAERTPVTSDFSEELRRRYGAANVAAGRRALTQPTRTPAPRSAARSPPSSSSRSTGARPHRLASCTALSRAGRVQRQPRSPAST